MSDLVQVYILDDHDDVRQALIARLCAHPKLIVVGDSGDADEGLLAINHLRPQLVLVETKRSDGRGLEIVDWITHSGLDIRVIVLTSYAADWEKWAAQKAGVARYLLKEIDSTQLIDEIERVMAGA